MNMRWIRNNRYETALAVAASVGIILTVLGVVSLWGGSSSDVGESATKAAPGSAASMPYEPMDGIEAATKPVERLEAKVAAGKKALGDPMNLPGLSGEGGTLHLPRHRVTVSMTSRAAINSVGYIIPTSLKNNYGVAKKVGTSWSMSTIVYGDPAYAQLFAQAGARGFPITCTITVDGKVTDRRSTEGPYGQLYCQG